MRSPVEARFAAPAEISDHPAVRAAARIGTETLEPHAPDADDPDRGVDPAHLAGLAEAGLFSVTVPAELGGHGASGRVAAEVVELVSASCAATWFVMTQHRTPAALVQDPSAGLPAGSAAAGPAAERYRAELPAARRRAGLAVAHLRRPGPPAIRAEPDCAGGYRFTGRADWCTGWGLIDLVMIAAATPDGRFVLALTPATTRPGLAATSPLPLAVMGGTRTVGLHLDRFPVPAQDVLVTVRASDWLERDRWATANARPATLGLLRRALVELEQVGVRRERPAAVTLANRLADRAVELRSRAYQLLTEVAPGERVDERTALRGKLAELTVRATQALIVARAGRAMLRSSPEQRWAREASFHLIQAQTDPVRTAQLTAFGATRP